MSLEINNQSSGSALLVTAAVVVENGRVLITKRPENKRHPGYWEFPGGKVNPGEAPEEALAREMLEELGVRVVVDRIFDVVYYRYEWGAVLILAYLCTLVDQKLQNIDVDEHKWISHTDFADYKMLPADNPIVDRLAEALP